jgi:hypothetical protein
MFNDEKSRLNRARLFGQNVPGDVGLADRHNARIDRPVDALKVPLDQIDAHGHGY